MMRKHFVGLILFIGLLFIFSSTPTVYADTAHCGLISSNETWSSAGNVHTVGVGCDSVTVGIGATLTITEGTIVKLAIGKSLIVNGTLNVQGTSMDPIYFTSYRDDTIGGDTNGDGGATLPSRDDWTTIRFNFTSINSVIDHAIIRYGGQDSTTDYGAIHLVGASPTIQNTTFNENAYCAITGNVESFPSLTGNTIEDNAANGYCLFGGTISTDSIWDITDTSYFIRDSVMIVGTGLTLTIAPDVVVKFGDDLSLIVNGSLIVQGTTVEPVYFTSKYDDTIRGDTNGDGGNILPARSQWTRIQFNSTSANSVIDHAIIRYGGQDSTTDYGAVHLVGASPTIQNTVLTENAFAGISTNESLPVLGCNDIYNNGSYGLYNSTPGTVFTFR